MAKTSIWAPCIKLGATEGCLIQKTRIWKALHWLFIALKTGSNNPGLTLRDKPLVLSLSLFPIALFLLCLSPRDTKASSIKPHDFTDDVSSVKNAILCLVSLAECLCILASHSSRPTWRWYSSYALSLQTQLAPRLHTSHALIYKVSIYVLYWVGTSLYSIAPHLMAVLGTYLVLSRNW